MRLPVTFLLHNFAAFSAAIKFAKKSYKIGSEVLTIEVTFDAIIAA